MLKISPHQMKVFESFQEKISLNVIVEDLLLHDPALTASLPRSTVNQIVEQAYYYARTLGLSSIGAVSILATISLACYWKPDAAGSFALVISVLGDKHIVEEERLNRANDMLFGIDSFAADEHDDIEMTDELEI